MIRKLIPSQVSQVGEDEVEVVIATGDIARDGHILVPGGVDLTNYLRNPVVLWQHSPDDPVGNAENVRVEGDKIVARVRFAPTGISEVADRTRGLVKSGVIQAVSVGFEPLDGLPLDPAKPRGGQRFTKWDLLEFSFVSVPADTGAIVTARAADASKEPAMAASRKRTSKPAGVRGLTYGGVCDLAYVVCELGYLVEWAKYEADIEGDGSAVPGMLGEALKQLGAALVAMTQEEVAELLAGHGLDAEEDYEDIAEGQRAWVRSGPTRLSRTWRARKVRAGKTISSATRDVLDTAHDKIEEARSMLRGLLDDTDSTEIQSSDGLDEDEGSSDSRALSLDARRRRARALMFATAD